MKLMKFPVVTHVIRAVCDCGGELVYWPDEDYERNSNKYMHLCLKERNFDYLSEKYPKYVHEQSSCVGEEVK